MIAGATHSYYSMGGVGGEVGTSDLDLDLDFFE